MNEKIELFHIGDSTAEGWGSYFSRRDITRWRTKATFRPAMDLFCTTNHILY